MEPAYPTVRIAAAAVVLSLVVLGVLGVAGWPGTPNRCFEAMVPTCFCETLRPGLVAQPANTSSNLGFVAVGLVIAAWADRRGRRARANRLTRTRLHPTLFAVVTALLGPGSMALHASMRSWGGLVDVASMYLYAALLVAYAAARAWRLSPAAFLAFYAFLAGGLVGAQASVGLPVEATFGGLLVATLVLELWVSRQRPELSIDRRFAGAAVGLFLLAFAVWIPSLSGGVLCDPESWLQGHAVWHLLCAGAAGLVFVYLASEDGDLEPEGAASVPE